MVPVVNPPLLQEEINHILRSIGMSTRQSDLEVALGRYSENYRRCLFWS